MSNQAQTDKSGLNREAKSSARAISTGTELLKSCPPRRYRELMLTQMEVYKRHIDLHVRYHPEVPAKGDLLSHFFGMFGDFFRTVFCTFACPDRFNCSVRTKAPFSMERPYAFDELDRLAGDPSGVSLLGGCPYARQQAAAQNHVAGQPRHLEKHKYYYGIHGQDELQQARRHFLSLYGPLIRDMFCSAACPLRGRCVRSADACRPIGTA